MPLLHSKPLLFGSAFTGLWSWAHKLATEALFPPGKVELMITNKMASVQNAQCVAKAPGPQPVPLLPRKLTGPGGPSHHHGFEFLSAHIQTE